jgi:hypothetical protein
VPDVWPTRPGIYRATGAARVHAPRDLLLLACKPGHSGLDYNNVYIWTWMVDGKPQIPFRAYVGGKLFQENGWQFVKEFGNG